MSIQEFQLWCAYRAKRGSLNLGLRIEQAVGMQSKIYVDAHRRKGSQPVPLHEFLPYHDKPEDIIVTDPLVAMQLWK